MANTMRVETWLNPAQDGRRFVLALVGGLLIEVLAFGLLLPWISHQVPPASSTPAPIKLSIVSPAPPAPPKPPPPKPVPPKPVTPPPPVPITPPAPVLPLPPPPPTPAPHRTVMRHIPQPVKHVAAVVPPAPPQTPPPPAPPPAAPAAPSNNELAQFAAAMHLALQNALIFPDSAQMAHQSGVVRIRFSYLNGEVSDITVIRSCGFPELDEAAVETARVAHYPPPPADFAGRVETVDVDVIFPQADTSVDSD